jgi:hypothetical protein
MLTADGGSAEESGSNVSNLMGAWMRLRALTWPTAVPRACGSTCCSSDRILFEPEEACDD